MFPLSGAKRRPKMETEMLKTNVGGIDRIVRVLVGLALLGLFFMYSDAPWRYWALIGIVPLATGLMGSCPVYSMLGLSTCPVKRA
jgi:hypothetical protein